MPVRDLIFDLGVFSGKDTEFYLAKGFRVVGVEARPDLCARARQKFAGPLASGQLVLVERAIWTATDATIPFYVRSGWSSVYRDSAERDGNPSGAIEVQTTTLQRLLEQFGTPHYLKCDIEGADEIVAADLVRHRVMPSFVSFEDPDGALAARLAGLGYDRFQMVNQGYVKDQRVPVPAREGRHAVARFDGTCSGLFGFELEPSFWVDHDRLQQQMLLWHRLREKAVNPLLGLLYRRWGKLTGRGWLVRGGWADIHATTAATLAART